MNISSSTQHPQYAGASLPLSAVKEPEVEDPSTTARHSKPSYTVLQAAQQITREDLRWPDRNGDGVTQIAVTFDKLAPGETAFNSVQKHQARLVMQSWADVTNVLFQEGIADPEGQLVFANSHNLTEDIGGWATLPGKDGKDGKDGKVLVNAKNKENYAPALHNDARLTQLHEVGHNIGLLHPGEYNGSGNNYRDHAVYAQDTRAYSAMSYFSAVESGHKTHGYYPSAPMRDDIAAAQRLYGANYKTRNTDTIYGFNANAGRDYYQLSRSTDPALFSVWDGGGVDTLDFSKYKQNQVIDLRPEAFSNVGGLVGNVSIAKGVTLENAVGGAGNDVIIGNHADNVLKGGAGADHLRGAEGADTFAYEDANDSTLSAPDFIVDFVSGRDKIDVSTLLSKAAIDKLTFVKRLSGKAGETFLDYNRTSNQSRLAIDLTGNGRFDFFVRSYGPINSPDIITKAVDAQRYT